jgi:hypothetical protein
VSRAHCTLRAPRTYAHRGGGTQRDVRRQRTAHDRRYACALRRTYALRVRLFGLGTGVV